ncbi:hypothetical protein [Novosphingobium sp. NBM11]|uniref:hypothetical protein n=1 Tax=Novosphingobium sp. NBM11 TaxID=2596914 RepID=UPI00189209B9|nr:hypothetical protein [Novosphingobium sp. NBM11]
MIAIFSNRTAWVTKLRGSSSSLSGKVKRRKVESAAMSQPPGLHDQRAARAATAS